MIQAALMIHDGDCVPDCALKAQLRRIRRELTSLFEDRPAWWDLDPDVPSDARIIELRKEFDTTSRALQRKNRCSNRGRASSHDYFGRFD